jgi:hypothetical protein
MPKIIFNSMTEQRMSQILRNINNYITTSTNPSWELVENENYSYKHTSGNWNENIYIKAFKENDNTKLYFKTQGNDTDIIKNGNIGRFASMLLGYGEITEFTIVNRD